MISDLESPSDNISIARERKIPGTIKVEWREFRYISENGKDNFFKLFDKLTTIVNPSNAKSGGATTENCKIRLPDGSFFHGLSYKGDIEGWRKDIEQGAQMLNLVIAKIEDDKIEVSDGRLFSLKDCTVEFYTRRKKKGA